jgi:hypothetical protein
MKGSVVLVAVTLAAAIVLTAALLLANSARGIELLSRAPATAGTRWPHGQGRAVDNLWRHSGVTNPL